MPCPASTKLMRRSTSGQWVTTVTPDGTQLVPYAFTRVALLIGPPLGAAVRLSLRTSAGNETGWLLQPDSLPLLLTLGDHGAMVQGPIYAQGDGDSVVVTCWDSHLPERIE